MRSRVKAVHQETSRYKAKGTTMEELLPRVNSPQEEETITGSEDRLALVNFRAERNLRRATLMNSHR